MINNNEDRENAPVKNYVTPEEIALMGQRDREAAEFRRKLAAMNERAALEAGEKLKALKGG
jgi:hypothetical protein